MTDLGDAGYEFLRSHERKLPDGMNSRQLFEEDPVQRSGAIWPKHFQEIGDSRAAFKEFFCN
jgi:hypothetical protein